MRERTGQDRLQHHMRQRDRGRFAGSASRGKQGLFVVHKYLSGIEGASKSHREVRAGRWFGAAMIGIVMTAIARALVLNTIGVFAEQRSCPYVRGRRHVGHNHYCRNTC